MNKSELVSAMAEKSGLTKVDCKKALEAAIAAVSEALKDGDKVSLVGFGSFSVVERAARQGVNPATGEAIDIAAKKNVKFKAGSELEL
ncbi:MAG: HU family DNA-binding protein [Bacteroidaceae bacterium]|nr:HU family DNA-binding protein [Bacteroidaceae bacterium]